MPPASLDWYYCLNYCCIFYLGYFLVQAKHTYFRYFPSHPEVKIHNTEYRNNKANKHASRDVENLHDSSEEVLGVPEIDTDSYANNSNDHCNGEMNELLESFTSPIKNSQ